MLRTGSLSPSPKTGPSHSSAKLSSFEPVIGQNSCSTSCMQRLLLRVCDRRQNHSTSLKIEVDCRFRKACTLRLEETREAHCSQSLPTNRPQAFRVLVNFSVLFHRSNIPFLLAFFELEFLLLLQCTALQTPQKRALRQRLCFDCLPQF